jgi:uncharacterized protein (TIGR03435 family)
LTTGGGTAPGGKYTMVNGPVRRLLVAAFRPDNPEIVGAPSWIDAERYDVSATANVTTSRTQLEGMLRTLLAERFQLRAHTDMREAPVYTLTVARPDRRVGPELHVSPLACAAVAAARQNGTSPPPVSGAPANGAPPCGLAGQPFGISSGGVTMDDLAGILKGLAGRTVLNRTDVTGFYEFTLKFTPEGAHQPNPLDDVSLFTALREQLGLELKPDRVSLRTLVIERIDRPTPN